MPSGIKVVHIATSDTGGAAIAAQRLHLGLTREGVDSTFLSLNQANATNYPKKVKFPVKKQHRSLSYRLKKRMGYAVSVDQKNAERLRGLQGAYEAFSFPATDFSVESHPLLAEADIINLHWIPFFVNYRSFFKAVKMPIVWTMHDMSAILGGFHYEGDKARNPAFAALEAQLKAEQESLLLQAENMAVVTPSKWLGAAVKNDHAFAGKAVHHIPYGLDTAIFKPNNRAFCKEVFNIPADKKIILFVCERLNNYRKGFDLLMEAIGMLTIPDDFLIVAIGESSELAHKPNVVSVGRIHDEHLLSVLYSAADIFVMPSREDNFPNVVLESLACGTPVMAFATGGMKETIVDGFNGVLVPNIDKESLAGKIADFVGGSYQFDRQAIRTDAVARYNLRVQAENYVTLYEGLLGGKGAHR